MTGSFQQRSEPHGQGSTSRDRLGHSAGLFLELADQLNVDGLDPQRVRSASEAFLFRRLQARTDTRDRFRLNAIPEKRAV
ncbi:MAG: hypothetical protein F4229_16825 [Gammaproteobacteria bacterium]|nr:hypothetical protein [Gammaproteobacteria bacterium]MYH14879.1 hypothetical protein [Gammaproteobacteria bacterium]